MVQDAQRTRSSPRTGPSLMNTLKDADLKKNILIELGVYPWRLRMPAENNTQNKWEQLQKQAEQCTACALHQTRNKVVFGVGNRAAQLMIIGEAPGFYEDQQGEPFVGRAGLLLNAMLEAINLQRESIYIANILKCRPPQNRDPHLNEVNTCTPFLNQQIELVQPKILLAVGRIAAHFLLKMSGSLESLRQKKHSYGPTQIPLLVTYHPAYLLRNPKDKKKAYADLLFLQEMLSQVVVIDQQ